jgi:hypothetical protein
VSTVAPASIRLSPADGIVLFKATYELRGRDGIKICDVARDKAEAGIRAGTLELWDGRHGAYLRGVGLAYPEDGSRRVSVSPDSRHTLHGNESMTAGANVNRLYRHNGKGCASWGTTAAPVKDYERPQHRLSAAEEVLRAEVAAKTSGGK